MVCTPDNHWNSSITGLGINDTSVDYTHFSSHNFSLDPNDRERFHYAEYIIDRYITHTICMFGIIGNLINILVLTRKTVFSYMGHLEKSIHYGLIALAASDLLYCLCSLPQAWKNRMTFGSPHVDFWLIYDTYGTALINCFLLSSSWLTVAMTTSRYLLICHPVRGHHYLSLKVARITIASVFAFSLVFNLPRFWMRRIAFLACSDGGRFYFHMEAFMSHNHVAHITYTWLHFIVGIFLPLVILAYCNIYLVRALYVSSRLRGQQPVNSNPATRIMTLTLCVIVLLYIILVGPAELVTFWKPFISENPLEYGLAVRICNCLQMLNFAINFILYFIINIQFRKVIKDLLFCIHLREHIQPVNTQSVEEHETHETSVML